MNKVTQIDETTSAELIASILKGFDERFDKLTTHFQSRKDPIKLIPRLEACKRLNISTVTEHEWRKKGILKAKRLGNKIYYTPESIQEALQEA